MQELSLKSKSLKSWLLAARPKTLTSAFVPILVGTFLAYAKKGNIEVWIPLLAFLAALCINIGTNLINDAIDFKKGADTKDRLGPTRVTQSGLLPMKQVYFVGLFCFGLAAVLSFPLLLKGGWPLVLLLILAIGSGYCYTGGPFPLAYHGLGEFFVLIFFGFVAVMAVFYLQTGYIDGDAWLAGAQIGLLDTVLLAINNLRDIVGDSKAQKKTLPVRFGIAFGRLEIAFLIIFPFVLGGFWISSGHFYAAILPWLAFPVGQRIIRNIWSHEPSAIYNSFFGLASLLLVLFGALLSIGLLLP